MSQEGNLSDTKELSGPLLLTFPDIAAEFDKTIAKYKEAAADGRVTLKEWWNLVVGAVMEFAAKAYEFSNLEPEKRKALIIEGVQLLYDKVIAPLDIPGIPNIIENTVVDPLIGKAINPIVSALIDQTLALLTRLRGGPEPSTPEVADSGEAGAAGGGASGGGTPPGFEPY